MATATTVEDELKEKRADYKRRMERVKDREEALKVKRADLQEQLVQFYKYIQDNEMKRLRANKKAASEESAKQERYQTIVKLSDKQKDLEREKQASRERYLKFQKYEKYLNDVLHHNDGDEYLEARDIIHRWQTLDDNRNVLQRRKTQLEDELAKHKVSLSMKKQRRKNESVDLQNQVSELQNQLETLQRLYKKKQDDLESSITHKSSTTKTIGQVRMACQNLYDRCAAVNAQYRGRAGRDEGEGDMLAQLQVIGDCLDDYSCIIAEWKKRRPRDETAAAAPGATGTAAAGGKRTAAATA